MTPARFGSIAAVTTLALFATACAKEKPAADASTADTSASASAAAAEAGAKAPDSTIAKSGAKQTIIGRDSVRQGPIIGIPTIADTAKKRPPK